MDNKRKNPIKTGSYLNPKLILLLDVAVSMIGSLLAIYISEIMVVYSDETLKIIPYALGASFVFSVLIFSLFRLNRAIIRHSTFRTIVRIAASVFCKVALIALFLSFVPIVRYTRFLLSSLTLDILMTFMFLVMMRSMMIVVYDFINSSVIGNAGGTKVFIYGNSSRSVSLIARLKDSTQYSPIAFLSFGNKRKKMMIDDYPVVYFNDAQQLSYYKDVYKIGAVIFSSEQELRQEQERLVKYCLQGGLSVLVAPSINEAANGEINQTTIREIKIEDLLGREEIKISMEEIKNNFKGKTVMVTGAAGSIGSELCRQLAGFGVKQLVLFDNAETPMHNLRLELEDKFKDLCFTPIIGDVRMKTRLDFAFREFRPQVVFHAAAYKHVPLMEDNPCEAVLVNVAGSRNVADKCLEYGVGKMVMVSTDKAVNPTNIMGCTKRLAEIYVQSLGLSLASKNCKTEFVTTRFGNVLGSNGSVIPRFREQLKNGGPITVTHPDITRFFMTIPEACRLVMEAATMSKHNEIFVFDMGESVKIDHLARRMIELAGLVPDQDIKIEYTGLRPGEKLYEEVLADNENTVPTSHSRIRIANVREYDHSEAEKIFDELETLARAVQIDDMVRLMKKAVPEFHSENSRFAAFD